MQQTFAVALFRNFLGHSPEWYKLAIIACLIINPILFHINPFIAGWALVLEFIFTLAMALKCYPLQPGGLLVIEALFIGMTTPEHVEHEIASQLEKDIRSILLNPKENVRVTREVEKVKKKQQQAKQKKVKEQQKRKKRK